MNFKMSWTLGETGGNKQISNWDMVLNQFKLIQGKKEHLLLIYRTVAIIALKCFRSERRMVIT